MPRKKLLADLILARGGGEMGRLHVLKNNFTAGEVSSDLYGRGDLASYSNAAKTLRNVLVQPTGGITRRPGLRHISTAADNGRLISFAFNAEQTYLLVVTPQLITILHDDSIIATLSTPWTGEHIKRLSWAQSADTLFICHPEVAPKTLTRLGPQTWALSDITFVANTTLKRRYHPFYHFAADTVTLTPSGTSGTITLTASTAIFDPGHVGIQLRLPNQDVTITEVTSATAAKVTLALSLPNTAAIADWSEQAFSSYRGWPSSVVFAQDRLVFGGAKSIPNRIWMSRTSDLFNFDLGIGEDDDAIEFGLLSEQVDAIRTLHSGLTLFVLTTGGEWQITGEPLTPATVQAKRQTTVGSPPDRIVPPRAVEGATVFAARSGRQIRELLYTDAEAAYQARELSVLASHLVIDPIDMDYADKSRVLYVVMSDGSLCALTLYRSENVTAWTRLDTDGAFQSVAVVGGTVYVLVKRSGDSLSDFRVEKFDSTLNSDAALSGETDQAQSVWGGLAHLNDKWVTVIADGQPLGLYKVRGGVISLAAAATHIEAGLPFAHSIEPLPPADNGELQGEPLRLIRAIFRIKDTSTLMVDVGRGPRLVPLQNIGAMTFDRPPVTFTGDVTVRALGWHRTALDPLWRITQTNPCSFTLLSVNCELKVND